MSIPAQKGDKPMPRERPEVKVPEAQGGKEHNQPPMSWSKLHGQEHEAKVKAGGGSCNCGSECK